MTGSSFTGELSNQARRFFQFLFKQIRRRFVITQIFNPGVQYAGFFSGRNLSHMGEIAPFRVPFSLQSLPFSSVFFCQAQLESAKHCTCVFLFLTPINDLPPLSQINAFHRFGR